MLEGLWTALPRWVDEEDDRRLGRALERIMAQGVDGFFVLGTTGLGADLTVSARQHMLEKLVSLSADAQRIVVAVSANASGDVRELVIHAFAQGVRGIALTLPFYGRFDPPEIERWAQQLFQNVKKEGDVYLYNIPSVVPTSWLTPVVESVDQLIGVDGIKDSSGNVGQLWEYLQWAEDHHASVLVGDERLTIYSCFMGAHGVVSGLSAAYPKLMVDLLTACHNSDWIEARRLQNLVNLRLKDVASNTPREGVAKLVQVMINTGILDEAISGP